ncbi:olfactory receptor 6N1-like [Pseudophryne corroboree]|uniref:olfactory receptor 6N1-like n=1 Tax=Pseudophryne corroboree TaxID=495146 RepID=UPI003081E433
MTLSGGRGNQTAKPEFTFEGFPSGHNVQIVLFLTFLLTYILTVIANFLIIMIVKEAPNLHMPMYMFIAALSFLEICYVTVTTPNMLSIFIVEHKRISFEGCMVQLYIFFSLGSSECFLLTVMAGDRYLAICNPLRYSSIMTLKACAHLILLCFLCGFSASVLTITFIATLHFCGPNRINHFFCDYPALLALSCVDSSTTEVVFFTLSWSIVLTCFLLTMTSYICIVVTIVNSVRGQRKTFSTCVSHLTVVSIFYGSVIFMYVRPKAKYNLNNDKVVSVVYSVVTPLLNPLIYALRNKNFQRAIQHFRKKNILLTLFSGGRNDGKFGDDLKTCQKYQQ